MKLRYIFHPAEILTAPFSVAALLSSFIVSGLAFALFFLQTSLDSGTDHVSTLLKGILFGTIGISIISIFIWLFAKISGSTVSIPAAISAINCSYGTTLIFVLVGLVLHFLLRWSTSVSCGITGVLAALGPMSGVIMIMTKYKKMPAIFIMTFAGLSVILFWGLLNNLI